MGMQIILRMASVEMSLRYAFYFLIIYCNTTSPSQATEWSVTNRNRNTKLLGIASWKPRHSRQHWWGKQTPTWIKRCFKTTLTNIYHEFNICRNYMGSKCHSQANIYICTVSNRSMHDLTRLIINTPVKPWIICKNYGHFNKGIK